MYVKLTSFTRAGKKARSIPYQVENLQEARKKIELIKDNLYMQAIQRAGLVLPVTEKIADNIERYTLKPALILLGNMVYQFEIVNN